MIDEKFIDRNIAEICEMFDKICGANKNIARMTPLFIDGLKPVHRRTIFVMYSKNQGKIYRKLASISGEVFGRLHPHSPASIEDAVVGLAQTWNNNIPLIDGSGNWGNCSGDRAGASRYIEAKLSEFTIDCYFDNWRDAVIDMVPNYNGEEMEPLYLPSKYPVILLNGSLGIGYAQASMIPPFNFREVVEACMILMVDPDANIVLIPDSPTGADIIMGDFKRICDTGNGKYTMRCKYEIFAEENLIKITNLPYQVTANEITRKIAELKEVNELPELTAMKDYSGKTVDIRLTIRGDINPYKFMRKLIRDVPGLEKTYPINIIVINDYQSIEYSIKSLLMEWIQNRREYVRIIVNHRRTTLLGIQRTNDVKIFLMNGNNLQITLDIFRTSRNRSEIESRLIDRYKNSEIHMDSLQAKTLSEMRMHELSIDSYEASLRKREEIIKEIGEIDIVLNTEKGIDKLIIAELKNGVKKYGSIRKSNVVPYKISVSTEVQGMCILQLSSDGIIIRKTASNVQEEPIPTDNNGFAVKVDNESSFIAVDENGYYSFIKVREIPVDQEVPLNRFIKQRLGNVVALLPFDIESDMCSILISKQGIIKKIRISEMNPSKRPCIELSDKDKVVKGIVTKMKSPRDILIYTKNGMGQRLDPNHVRLTSVNAKGISGFKLQHGDEIIGCYSIMPEENQYLLYVTIKGKMRLNIIGYLPMRDSKHDRMFRLIALNDRDRLLNIIGCNRLDKLQVYFNDGDSEIIDISKLEESTMSSDPKKITSKSAVSSYIVKTKLL